MVGGIESSALVQTGILFSDLGFYLDQAEQLFDLFYFVNNNEVYGVIHDSIPGIIHGVIHGVFHVIINGVI